ncbi:MAG: pyridoxal-phosphate dependent enzyme [Gilvibacter sp.]
MKPPLKKEQIAQTEPVIFDGMGNNQLFVLREDLIGAPIYGNKYRKLVYNLARAKELGQKTLLTFGGAYSNHIAAVAAIGNHLGFKTIGIIRGDELSQTWRLNPTLLTAFNQGMQFEFISRALYRQKHSMPFIKMLNEKYNHPYVIPEGGTNSLAIKGCEEILTDAHQSFDVICVAVGTGGTLAGLTNSCLEHQSVLGFSSLKGDFLKNDIKKWTDSDSWSLTDSYSFGGYGKISEALITFINRFKQQTGIGLDPLYTGKMMYGIIDLLKSDYFPEKTRILAVHTGGLQGINGMNQKLLQKGWPLLS